MVDSEIQAGNTQMSLENFVVPESKAVLKQKRSDGGLSKEHRGQRGSQVRSVRSHQVIPFYFLFILCFLEESYCVQP